MEINTALQNLNVNKLCEIRIRSGQPVIVQYDGEYKYLGASGICINAKSALKTESAESVLRSAIAGNVYGFSEQLKKGFITVEKGVRIGVAGEYITEGEKINTLSQVTSLNIRIPHDIYGCSDYLFQTVLNGNLKNILIFSKPGFGKTTMLRDVVRKISKLGQNVLLFDERNEISGVCNGKFGFNIGECVDVVRGPNKLYSIKNAIRVLNPDVIVCDELYGQEDISAIEYAADCEITVIATTHVCDKNKLCVLPFDYYVKLLMINEKPVIYDKNFVAVCGDNSNDVYRGFAFRK